MLRSSEVKVVDRFFTQKFCDRCGGSLESGRIMSMYNTECICIECKERELLRRDYRKAADADHAEIKKGNFNYKGIKG